MTDWTSLDLVPSPAWRGNGTRTGLAMGPTGLWIAQIDPTPEAPRLTLLQHEPLPNHHGPLGPSSTALATIGQDQRLTQRNVGLALGAGSISGLQEVAPLLPDTALKDDLLRSGLASHAIWAGGPPSLAWRVLSRSATKTRLLYAGTSQATQESWQQTLANAGLQLAGIEPLPLAVLRGLIAVGDLDASQRWGLAVISQDRCWVSLWSNDELVLWREHPAPPLGTTAGTEPDPEDLLVLTRTIKAAWRFGGITPDTKLWLVADEPDMADLLQGILQDQNLPVEVPLHARLGPLAAGGAAALAALGEAAADTLTFPPPLWPEPDRPERPRPSRKTLTAAAVAAGLLTVGLAGYALLSRSAGRIVQSPQPPSPTALQQRPITTGTGPGWPLDTILTQVSLKIPQDTWLTALDVREDGHVTLSGEAMAVRSPMLYSWSLTQLPGWQHVRLAELTNQGDTYRFTVEATLDAATLVARRP